MDKKISKIFEINDLVAALETELLDQRGPFADRRDEAMKVIGLLKDLTLPLVAETVNRQDLEYVKRRRADLLEGTIRNDVFKKQCLLDDNKRVAYYLLVFCEISGVDEIFLMDTKGGFLDAVYAEHSKHPNEIKQSFQRFLDIMNELHSVHRA